MSTTGAPGRQRLVRALAAVSIGGIALAAWFALTIRTPEGASHHEGEHGHTPAAPTAATPVSQPVGNPLVAPLVGASGTVRLEIAAEVAPPAPRLETIPLGVPVILSFELAASASERARAATLSAHRLATGNLARIPVALAEPELLIFDRRSGLIGAPAPSGGGHAGHAATPGVALAQSSLRGGALTWAATLAPNPDAAQLSPDGRWFVATYPTRGEIGVVDVLRRELSAPIATGGKPSTLRFAPDGRLWVLDQTGGRAVAVDLASRRVAGSVALGKGGHAIAFDDRDARALVTSADQETAILVDQERLSVVGSPRVGPGAVDVTFAPATRSFVVAGPGGRLTSLPIGADGTAQAERSLDLDRGVELAAVRVAPDGRTVAALDQRGGRLFVLDGGTLDLRAQVPVGSRPASLDVLERFALIRDAASPTVTWVDLREPSRSDAMTLGDLPAGALRVAEQAHEALATGPDDRWVYRIHVMMGRPMVMGQVRNALNATWADVAAGGLQRIGRNRFAQRTIFTSPGRYRLALRLKDGGATPFTIRVTSPSGPRVLVARPRVTARVGEPVTLEFSIRDADPATARVLAYGGEPDGMIRQLHATARRTGPGRYSATLVFRFPGRYRASLTSEQVALPTGPAVDVRVSGATR